MVLATREPNVTRKLSEEPWFRSAMQFSQVGITRRIQAKGLYMYIYIFVHGGYRCHYSLSSFQGGFQFWSLTWLIIFFHLPWKSPCRTHRHKQWRQSVGYFRAGGTLIPFNQKYIHLILWHFFSPLISINIPVFHFHVYIYIYIDAHLEPKYHSFWLEKALFWGVDL